MAKNNHSNPTAVNMQKNVDDHLKKGALHSELGIKQSKHISTSELQHKKAVAKRTHNTTLMKRVVQALNFRK